MQIVVVSTATFVVLFLLLLAATTVSSELIRRKQEPSQKESKYRNSKSEFRSNISSSSNSKSKSCLDQSDHPDRMMSFPGWNQPLPSAWYSGCKYNRIQYNRIE